MIGFIIGAVIGVAFAVVGAMLAVSSMVKKSNDWGGDENITASLKSFKLTGKKDNISSRTKLEAIGNKWQSS